MMSKSLPTLALIFVLATGWAEDSYACDDLAAQLTAKSYVLTMPLLGRDNEMIPLMQAYPGQFTRGGGAIRCMESLGAALSNRGIQLDQEWSGSPATERFGSQMPGGLADLPGQVDEQLRGYATDISVMGESSSGWPRCCHMLHKEITHLTRPRVLPGVER